MSLTPSEVPLTLQRSLTLLFSLGLVGLKILYHASFLNIFKVSKSNQILNYPSFCTYLKRIYLEQEYAAKLEFKEGNFSKIWGNFMPIFSG